LIPFKGINPLPFPGEQLLSVSSATSPNKKLGFLRIAQFSPSKKAVEMIVLRVRSSPPEMKALRSGVLPSLNNEACPSNWKWMFPSIPLTLKRVLDGSGA